MISTAWSRKHQPSVPIDVRLDRPVEEMPRALAVRFDGLPVRVLVAEDNIVNQKVARAYSKRSVCVRTWRRRVGKRWSCSAFCPTI
jgi:hypothetical protein